MKNYSKKTNCRMTRYRTPSTFRIRKCIQVNYVKGKYANKKGAA